MDLIKLFEEANENLLKVDMDLFLMKVSERTLCGALMLQLHSILKNTEFREYYTDIEYNRNKGGAIKTCIKTMKGPLEEIININCDLIVHSRGRNIMQDNLIAVEMKKSTRPESEKVSDRNRLRALTKDSFDDTWSFDGKTLPEHVCRYQLGVFYEIYFDEKKINLEYYATGQKISSNAIYY